MPSKGGTHSGFTRMEVVVVTAMILVLTAGSLVRAGRGHFNARSTVCLANQRELAGAWTAYALDHGGNLAGGVSWTKGIINYPIRIQETYDPTLGVERGQLWPYTRRVDSVFRCPEDTNGLAISGQWRLRVRSYSMNLMVSGEAVDGTGFNVGWMQYKKKSQIDGDQPATRFVFIEEHPSSINDGGLVFSMSGYPDNPARAKIVDYPAAYHEGACTLSFADEHAELRTWVDVRTSPPLSVFELPFDVSSPFNQDIRWMQERTTGARKP